ncbi:hypothetical protein EW145_g6463, partial [Phellinidium pouzarii]
MPFSVAASPLPDLDDNFGLGNDDDDNVSFTLSPEVSVKHEDNTFAYVWPQAAPSVLLLDFAPIKLESDIDDFDFNDMNNSKRSLTQTVKQERHEELDLDLDALSLSFDEKQSVGPFGLGIGVKSEDGGFISVMDVGSSWGQPVDLTQDEPVCDLAVALISDGNSSKTNAAFHSDWKDVELLGPDSVHMQEFEDKRCVHLLSSMMRTFMQQHHNPLISLITSQAFIAQHRSLPSSMPTCSDGSLETELDSVGPASPPSFGGPGSPATVHEEEPITIASSDEHEIERRKECPPCRVVSSGFMDIGLSETSAPWERGMVSQEDVEEHLLAPALIAMMSLGIPPFDSMVLNGQSFFNSEELFMNQTLQNEAHISEADGKILLQQDNEDDVWSTDNLKNTVLECMNDFHEVDDSPAGQFATQMAASHIAEGTLKGYRRIICDFIMTLRKMKGNDWNPISVMKDTPKDIVLFIAHKCGPSEQGCDGKKFATAVSSRAALSYWYGAIHPNESLSTWKVDKYGICHGLPTRAELVSKFMHGLEKTKAKQGDVSTSARAICYEDMINLFFVCIEDPQLSSAQQRAGVVRYAVYLFAWLLLERLGETLELDFRNLDYQVTYIGVKMLTRKNAQTGEIHEMRLYPNDLDPKICPMRALLSPSGLVEQRKMSLLWLRVLVVHNAPVYILEDTPYVHTLISDTSAPTHHPTLHHINPIKRSTGFLGVLTGASSLFVFQMSFSQPGGNNPGSNPGGSGGPSGTAGSIHARQTPVDVNALLQLVANMTTQLQTLTQVVQQGPAQAPARPARAPKVAVPNVYDGAMDKAEDFIREVQLYVNTHAAEFPSHEEVVYFTLSYMGGGTVQNWKNNVLEACSVAAGQTPPNFSLCVMGTTAIAKMEALQQGTDTCDEFTVKFQALAPRTHYNDAALIELYKKKLNRRLLEKLYSLPNMPNTLQWNQTTGDKGWYQWAMQLDRQWREFGAQKRVDGEARKATGSTKGGTSARSGQQEQGKAWNAPSYNRMGQGTGQARDPNAMDVDQTR